MNNNQYNGLPTLDPTGQPRVEQGQQTQGSRPPMDLGTPFTEQYLAQQQELRAEKATIVAAQARQMPGPENPATAANQGTPIPRMPDQMDLSMQQMLMMQPTIQREEYQPKSPRPSGVLDMKALSTAKSQFTTLVGGTPPQPGSILKDLGQHKDVLIGNSLDMNQLGATSFLDQATALINGNSEERRQQQLEAAKRVSRKIQEYRHSERGIVQISDWSAQQELQTTDMQETQQLVQSQAQKIEPSKNILGIIAKMNPRQALKEYKSLRNSAKQAAEAAARREQQRQLKTGNEATPNEAGLDVSAERRAGRGAKGMHVG